MEPDITKILSSTECLSNSQMSDYLRGKLNAKQKHEVEAHLADCEMCRDEMDGYQEITDISRLANIIHEINRKIRTRIKRKSTKTVGIDLRVSLAIAAVMVSVITLSVFIIYQINPENKKQLAESFKADSTHFSLPVTVTKTEEKSDKLAYTKQKHADNKDNSVISGGNSKLNKEIKDTALIISKVEQIEEADITKEVNENLKIRDTNNIITANLEKEVAYDIQDVKSIADNNKRSKRKIRNEKADETIVIPPTSVNSSAKKFDGIKDDSSTGFSEGKSDDVDVLYSSLLNYYNQKQWNGVISIADKLTSKPNKYLEDAKWLRANAYLEKGKQKTAIRYFKELAGKDGKYKIKSEAKLKELIK